MIYQTPDRTHFDFLKEECLAKNFKLDSTKITAVKELCSIYSKMTHTIDFCTGFDKESNKNYYTVSLRLNPNLFKK